MSPSTTSFVSSPIYASTVTSNLLRVKVYDHIKVFINLKASFNVKIAKRNTKRQPHCETTSNVSTSPLQMRNILALNATNRSNEMISGRSISELISLRRSMCASTAKSRSVGRATGKLMYEFTRKNDHMSVMCAKNDSGKMQISTSISSFTPKKRSLVVHNVTKSLCLQLICAIIQLFIAGTKSISVLIVICGLISLAPAALTLTLST